MFSSIFIWNLVQSFLTAHVILVFTLLERIRFMLSFIDLEMAFWNSIQENKGVRNFSLPASKVFIWFIELLYLYQYLHSENSWFKFNFATKSMFRRFIGWPIVPNIFAGSYQLAKYLAEILCYSYDISTAMQLTVPNMTVCSCHVTYAFSEWIHTLGQFGQMVECSFKN